MGSLVPQTALCFSCGPVVGAGREAKLGLDIADEYLDDGATHGGAATAAATGRGTTYDGTRQGEPRQQRDNHNPAPPRRCGRWTAHSRSWRWRLLADYYLITS